MLNKAKASFCARPECEKKIPLGLILSPVGDWDLEKQKLWRRKSKERLIFVLKEEVKTIYGCCLFLWPILDFPAIIFSNLFQIRITREPLSSDQICIWNNWRAKGHRILPSLADSKYHLFLPKTVFTHHPSTLLSSCNHSHNRCAANISVMMDYLLSFSNLSTKSVVIKKTFGVRSIEEKEFSNFKSAYVEAVFVCFFGRQQIRLSIR